MKLRIEVDEMGRHVLILPEEVIEEYQLEDGDSCTWYIDSDMDHAIIIHF